MNKFLFIIFVFLIILVTFSGCKPSLVFQQGYLNNSVSLYALIHDTLNQPYLEKAFRTKRVRSYNVNNFIKYEIKKQKLTIHTDSAGKFLSIHVNPSQYRKIIFQEDKSFNYVCKNIDQINEHISHSLSDSLNFFFGDRRLEFSYFTDNGKDVSLYALTAAPQQSARTLLDEFLSDSSSTDSQHAGQLILSRIGQWVALDTSTIHVVSFTTSHCPPCQSQHKTLETLRSFNNKIHVTYISTDSLHKENSIVVSKSDLRETGIHAFPTNVIYVPGHGIVYAGIGAVPYDTLLRMITPFL